MASNSNYTKSKSAVGRSENLRKIFELFIAPLFPEIKLTEAEMDGDELMAKLEYFFGVKYRDIIVCKAKRDFRLEGSKWKSKSTPHCIVPANAHESMVHKGDHIWVRIDLRTPDYVEVETDRGIFRVDSSKWRVYYEHIEEIC
jgi:hypothetical protein